MAYVIGIILMLIIIEAIMIIPDKIPFIRRRKNRK